ncbi:MAG: class I SAM-dependent methyltransferase [Bdellovibrionota bacterium]
MKTKTAPSGNGGSVNKGLWNEFYEKNNAPLVPSSFAQECLKIIDKTGILFELGCGNGRDSIFFISNDIQVIGCDSSESAIKLINDNYKKHIGNESMFICDDFTALDNTKYKATLSTVYSRFTMHSVTDKAASSALSWAFSALKNEGLLLIEARSVKDKMYGVGQEVGRDAFINHHYRRFLRKEELLSELESLGFVIENVVESDNLAVYQNDNPVVVRVVARKK